MGVSIFKKFQNVLDYSQSILLVFFVATIAFSVLSTASAHASSVYDNVSMNGGSAVIKHSVNDWDNPTTCGIKEDDLQFSWYSIFANSSKWTSSYASMASTYKASYDTQLLSGTGFGMVQIETHQDGVTRGNGATMIDGDTALMVIWSSTGDAEFDSGSYIGKALRGTGITYKVILYYDASCQIKVVYAGSAYSTAGSHAYYTDDLIAFEPNSLITLDIWKPVYLKYNITYPSGYEGDSAPYDNTDSDGDGLDVTQESFLGTSDSEKDTDGDGLSDYTESPWNTNRDDIFCGVSACAYPDALKKDIYVELDWMDDGTKAYKPTSTQLGMVVSMFNAHNINLHFDTGDYGGGNELTTYTSPLLAIPSFSQVDFYDYKSGGNSISSNFSSDRNDIWHYMISGNRYTYDIDPSDSSGWASVMGGNSFIALGYVLDDNSVASQDRAVADTVAHELGHNICLSPTRLYNEQPSQCVYQGVDNSDSGSAYYNLENYESVMNYRYQLTDYDDLGAVKYSEGTNTTYDHDDWGGINSAVGLFNAPRTLYTEFGAGRRRSAMVLSTYNNSNNLDPDGNVVISENPTPKL